MLKALLFAYTFTHMPISANPNASVAEVELDVYSGMPNPKWMLSEPQTRDLLGRLAALPRISRSALPNPLGYRGFVVRVSDAGRQQVIQVGRGVVSVSSGAQTHYGEDANRALERWLLDSGSVFLNSELTNLVQRELR